MVTLKPRADGDPAGRAHLRTPRRFQAPRDPLPATILTRKTGAATAHSLKRVLGGENKRTGESSNLCGVEPSFARKDPPWTASENYGQRTICTIIFFRIGRTVSIFVANRAHYVPQRQSAILTTSSFTWGTSSSLEVIRYLAWTSSQSSRSKMIIFT